MNTRQTISAAACLLVISIGGVIHAAQVTLTANDHLNGGDDLGTAGSVPPDVPASGGNGSRGNPWIYQFASGSNGLDLASYKLYTDRNVSLGDDSDSIRLDMGGESIVGTGAVAISTYPGVGTGWDAGHVTIVNVGNVDMGGIDTHGASGSNWNTPAHAGAISIGGSANRAGNIRVSFLRAYCQPDYTGNGAVITIYGSGDVLVRTDQGTAGDILTTCWQQSGGDTRIRHDGAFCARNVHTYTRAGWASSGRAGHMTFNGDIATNGPSGPFEAAALDSSYKRGSFGNGAGHILITGYEQVHIETNVFTYNNSTANGGNYDAGDVTITNVTGNITIGGRINLNGAMGSTYDGTLTLRTGDEGRIYVGDLDLDDVEIALFDSGKGRSYITGVLTSFTGPYDPKLRTPAGQKIHYDPDLNPSLNRGTYQLYALDGVSDGGELSPVPIPGTIILLQ
jgi:hypothetical protein